MPCLWSCGFWFLFEVIVVRLYRQLSPPLWCRLKYLKKHSLRWLSWNFKAPTFFICSVFFHFHHEASISAFYADIGSTIKTWFSFHVSLTFLHSFFTESGKSLLTYSGTTTWSKMFFQFYIKKNWWYSSSSFFCFLQVLAVNASMLACAPNVLAVSEIIQSFNTLCSPGRGL